MDDKTKILYDQLTKDGYDIGDYNSFSNNVKDDNKRKSLYDAITKDGYDVGDYDTFSAKLVGNNSQPTGVNNVTTTPQPTNTEETFVQNPKVKERILANTPDYFKSKGNNLSTLPLGTNIQDANDIAQEEQQRVSLAERAANDPYMRQQELEHVFKPKNQEQINSVNKMIADARRKRAEERRKNARAVKSDGLFSTLSQAYVAGEQNDTDKQLEYASSLMEEAQNITNEAKKKGNTNFFAGFARGFKDAPLDGWAMGLQDLKNYSAAKKVLDKVDKGEQLNPAEDALMQALVTNAATKMYYSGDLGRGYKAGSVTAESLPFMLDMIAGMGTIQAVTKPASKALVKYATEKAAKYGLGKATTGLAKGAARTIAGLGDVAAHTATFGGARVAADYQRRGMGDIQVSPNMDGTVSYAGRDNVQTGAEAIAKSAISTAAETGTELLGEYFAPMLGWVGKVTGANKIGKIIPASVGKAYSNIVNSQGFKNIQEIASRAKIADPIGEYGEEVVNNLISTAIGDMTPEELVDLDQNIDTFLGVAPMSVLFGSAGTGGYLREKYKNYRDMRTFENEMQETMGEDWSGVKEALQDADIETARDMVKDVLSSDMQPDMKKKAINYISSVLQEQTLQEVDKQQMPEQIAQAKQGIIANMQKSKDTLIKKGMSENEISTSLNDTFNLSPEEMEGKYGVDRANDIYNYRNAYTDYADYNYWVQNKAFEARKEAESQVEKMTNATTRTVMRVNSGLSKNPVNVLRGNIVFDNDGNVDQNQSDNTIYYLADDGKVKMAPISMFQSLVDDTSAEGLAQQAGQDAEEEVLQGEEAQINFTPEELQQQIIGTRFTQGGNNYEVTSKAADGYVVAALDEEGNQIQSQLVPEDDLFNAINSQNQVQPEQPVAQPDMNAQPQEEEPVQAEQPATQENPSQPETAMSRIPLNEQGEQDFEKAPVEDTSAALIEISDSVDDAKDTAQQMIDNYNNELKKAEKAKTTGSSIQEIVRLKQEKKANIQAINDKIAYWNNVASQIESQRPGGIIAQAEEEAKANQQRLDNMTQEQQQAAQQEVQKKIDSGVYEKKQPRKRVRYVKEDSDMGESVTPLEHVLREIATGRVTFNWNDSGITQGLGSHLGLASSPEERKKLIWALSSDGMTPEAAAEQIHADMPENLQGMVTDQDIFNMILNSFQEYGSPSKMWEEAKRMHGTDIEENIPGYDEDMERMQLEWEAENNGMTVPEWINYCDYIEEELNNRYSSVSDEELNTIFEQIYNDYEQRRTETESAGSTEGQPDGKQGDEVLPASESDNTGTGAKVEEQPKPADQADGESGSVVPEPEGTVKTNNEPVQVNVKGLFKDLYDKEKTKFSDNIVSTNETVLPDGTKIGKINEHQENFSSRGRQPSTIRTYRNAQVLGHNGIMYFNKESKAIKSGKIITSEQGFVLPIPQTYNKEVILKMNDYLYNNYKKNIINYGWEIGFGTSMFENVEDAEKFKDILEKAHTYAVQSENIKKAREDVDQNPTEAQKEAGNYKKGHVKIDGYNVTIENPKGSVRSGKDANGNEWSVTMNNDYGYIRGTEGVDGDHIDVFLSDNPESGDVFVIDQVNPDGSFDEHKVMYGFKSALAAKRAYLANYSKGWTRLGNITRVSKEEFKKWIDSSNRKTKPFAEYKSVKPVDNNKVTSVEEFMKNAESDYSQVERPSEEDLPELKKIANNVLQKGKNKSDITTEEGYNEMSATFEVIYPKEKFLLDKYRDNGGAAWVDYDDKCVYRINYDPAKYKGKSDKVTVIKEYFKTPSQDNSLTEASRNRIVSSARYEELKKRMREKINQLNAGIDPEIIAIGAEMAVYHIERGAIKFADYASAMIKDMGDMIRPYLKAFYSSARYMPQAIESGLPDKMTPDSEVSKFDVTNFDKKSIDVLEQIKNVAKEQEVERSQKSNKVKPASELSGDSAQYQDRDIQEKEAVKNIGVTIRERALNYVDEVSNAPLTMKDVKNILKDYSMLADMSITDMQELVELAMTNETRKVALKYIDSKDKKFGYDLIVAMYKMQPILNARDSTRFERQQYSTPTPFGYVMGQFINANKKVESVLEPSAGNGALTITFPAPIVHVNDIDERRIQNLRTLGYGEVTTRDALLPFDESVDAVVTNPPFGTTVTKEFDDGKLKISSLEGLMAINALDSMKDDGRAAIIIGGNTSYRENGAMQSKDMKLFAYLYSHYNVVDVINLDGEMYKRNGTKFNERIILINGRKTGPFKLTAPPVKSKARAEQVKTFDELYNRIQDDIRSIQQMGDLFNGTEGEARTTDNTGSGENSNVSNRPKSGERGKSVQPGKELGSSNDVGSSADATISGQGTNGEPAAENETGTVDNANGSDAGSTPVVQEQGNEQRGSEGGRNTGGVREGNSVPTDSGNNAGRGRLAVNLGDEKVPYPNRSQSGTLMSVVPANQAQVLADSLANIGDVDQFLVDELGYSSKEELFGYLAAEQIDSVSLAINQMNKGNGFIIGDMTGVGKGRQGAALVRYAVRKGYKPIYFTQKPALFADNYRDLSDIGSSNLRPFIIASDPKNAAITDAAGNVVHKLPREKERKRVFDYILKNGTLPDEYDYVITTYSQINNGTKEYEATDNGISEKDKKYKKKSPSAADKSGQIRRDVIKALSKNNIMILDESHTAGGSGGGSMFMQYIMPDVKGVTFLSATFAKRADNMPLYAMKTDLAKSGVSPQEMIQAIAQGGVTLQEIMSKQLVQSGQMIRRERDFSGVTIDWMPVNEEEDAVQRKQFDEVSSIFSDIRAFQKDYITPMVTNLSDELAGEGGFSDLQQGTKELGVTNTPFASKMYNLVNQLLFSLKADAVANRVIYNLKNGFKPIISFTNTMEGFLDEAPKDTPMDKVPNFSLTLMRALDGVMRYSVDTLGGEKENKAFLVSELNDEGQKRYYEIRNKIENLSANLPISPMDAIKMKIEQEGYKVGEITGRTLEMVKDENGKYVIQNRKDKDKKTAARDFNNGKLDVLMINKSGSTGISLHASPKFEDQRQRVMVFAQFQSDINDEVQMRGRIDRTGQIYRGKYEYIMSSIPAEQRLQMMFKAKLKSLDANTTSSQKSKFNEMEVVDYLNKYGDDVTWQYMVEHPELSEKLGDPLGLLNQEDEEDSDNVDSSRKEGCAAKIARYLPFLPVSDQEEVFKEITDAYNVKIQLLNDAGENDLEITTMPLRAKTISKKIWKPGTDPNSGNAFADNTYLEEVEVDVLKKPMKASEIKSTVSRMTEGEDFSTWRTQKIKEIESVYNDKIESLKNRLSESAEERSQKAKKLYIEKSKEARKNKKNEFTDEEIEKMSDVVVEDILKKADESFNKQKKVIEARKENILKQVNSFEPLSPLVIPFNLDEDMATLIPSRGIFLGFKFSKDFSPSSSTAVFATMDGRRKVEIPLKQEKAFRSINMNTMMQPTFIKDVNIDNWDSYTPTQSRKKSYIITGNLLQALVDIQKNPLIRGYLVSYSTDNGDTRQGILMSDSFKPGDLTMSVPISSKLIQIQQGESVISDDKRVIVEKNNGWKSGYVIKVPRSKKMGGEFFEDNKLRSLADNKEFVTRGNYMVAEISSDNLPEALDRLSKMGVNVAKKAKLEDADAGDVRLREDNTRSIVDPFINDLMKESAGEDLSRYPFEDKRTDPNNDYNVYWGYSEPLYNGKNIDGNEEVPEVIRDIIRNDEYEIDKQNIIDTLKRYIEFNEGFDEELEYKKVLDWFQENKDKFSMSHKVNLIVDRDSIPDNLYRVEEKDDAKTSEEVKSVSEKLNVPVEVVTSPDQIKDQSVRKAIESGRKVKGWYSISEGKVYLYLPNATSMEDAVQTLLHEGVAHYGLRRLVGEERMDDFLDDIFTNASKEVRQRIIDSLPKYGYNSRIATEEYMARMAEKGVDDVSFWDRIKQAFKNLLRRIGINISINDNELRYILWRSRQNLNMERPLDMAKDVAMQYQMGVGNYYRDDTSDGSREAYENSLQGWRYKAREAYQDSMLALKNLQDVVAKVSGKPIQGFENAYIAENQLSSRNTTEARRYNEKFFKPLMAAEGKLIKKYGLTHKAIERYMMLAHGIERNVEMTFREQLNDVIKNNPDDAEQFAEDFRQEKKRLRGLYSGYQYLKKLTDYIGEVGDYSATKAILQSMDNENHDSFQDDALDYVKDFENTYDVKELWDKTNKATKETLRKSYESGMMSKDHFANVSNMFMYYVPLRGWNEQTAEDVYDYINSERSPVNSVLKSMKGRKSIPDEIMATIGNMAESAIVQGNRNLMKQAFMNMVMNHPTDLATLKKAWYVYDPVTDEWNISFPDIEENDTPETIAQKIQDHEDIMKKLKDQGIATQKSSKLNINYKITKGNAKQHVVQVKNGGKDYLIYVNANPRASQAVNGLTNPDAEKNPIFNAINTANRWLAANFTTRNPAFVMSNLSRDIIFSMAAINIKEDGKYSARFRKNIFKAMPVIMRNLRGNDKGTESDKYFKEFIENGGETGYMHLTDVKEYKKKVRQELRKITGKQGSARAAFDYTLERLEDFNRWAEDVSRFSVYMTSRQMGRSIVESINDAKEVTVNFNKKGAVYKTGGFFGITAGAMRNLYLFFNASVQSLTNFNRLRVKNPAKFYSTLGGFMAAGFLMPVINNLFHSIFGDGNDPYNDLPEWVRRNNLCIYAGDGQFVTIPLPIELRAFYGLGDYAYQLIAGREKPTPAGISKGTISQLADLLPLNPTGNEGFRTFMPDALSPIFETYVWNEDFTGKPIAKLTPFNERDPEWKRVYKGTSAWLIDTSKFLNDLSNGGGPGKEFRKGFIDFNPAKVENLFESYFGGMAKFLNQAGKTIYYGSKSLVEGEKDDNLIMRNVPALNRFVNTVDERNAFSGINTEYFNLRDEMEQFKYELNGVKKNFRKNPEEYRQMVRSDMFQKYMKYKPYQKKLDKLYQMGKEQEGEERKQTEDMITETRRELLQAVK